MKDTIGSRVGRIVSASVNALIGAVENAAPEMVMEQAIREVEEVIEEVRTELGQVLARKHLAGKRLAEEREKHGNLTEKGRLAMAQGREDLAEAAVAHQLDIEAQLPVLEKALHEADSSEKELEGYVSALVAKRREMKEALAQFSASRQASVSAESHARGPSYTGKLERADSAFERVMEKSSGLPAGGTNTAQAAKLQELEELSRQNRIHERLAALKAEKPETP